MNGNNRSKQEQKKSRWTGTHISHGVRFQGIAYDVAFTPLIKYFTRNSNKKQHRRESKKNRNQFHQEIQYPQLQRISHKDNFPIESNFNLSSSNYSQRVGNGKRFLNQSIGDFLRFFAISLHFKAKYSFALFNQTKKWLCWSPLDKMRNEHFNGIGPNEIIKPMK